MLHGWPGDRTDYRAVAPPVSAVADVVVPDLRGFGESDKHEADPARQYNAVAQARSLIALIEELGLVRPVLVGYDIGSRIAQAIARDRPDLVRALVIAPPLPGIGDRILQPKAQQEFWYQAFHQLELCTELVDGQRDAVRSYLRHFWSHWSGPRLRADQPASQPPGIGVWAARRVHRLDRLVPGGRRLGRGLAGRAGRPNLTSGIWALTTVLWPEYDPLFPREWSDRIGEFFAAATLTWLDDAGHFSPVEAPDAYAAAITAAARTSPGRRGVAYSAHEIPRDGGAGRQDRDRDRDPRGRGRGAGLGSATAGDGDRRRSQLPDHGRPDGRAVPGPAERGEPYRGRSRGRRCRSKSTSSWTRGPREVAVPVDLAAALAQDDTARANFDGLSFTHRKEWVRWIEEAKKPETRATRLDKTVESLRAGKRAR